MNELTCPREDELLSALERGYVGAEMLEHAASCKSCHELHLVAGALLDERVEAAEEAHVPTAGTMMWRMRVRHRQDVELIGRRAMVVVQALSLLVTISLVTYFFGSEIKHVAQSAFATVRFSTPLLLAFALTILAAPIAGWVAIRQK